MGAKMDSMELESLREMGITIQSLAATFCDCEWNWLYPRVLMSSC